MNCDFNHPLEILVDLIHSNSNTISSLEELNGTIIILIEKHKRMQKEIENLKKTLNKNENELNRIEQS